MLKLLVKKQLAEIFRGYFWDSKKNKMRSKGATIAFFLLFGFLMIVIICGMFTALALAICKSMVQADADWLYFTMTGVIAVLFGVFGSVFNTYTGLYLSKDNDLLLSMPIPVQTIVASRIITVYVMSLVYSAAVSLPSAIVYFVFASLNAAKVVGAVVSVIGLSVFSATLSCALGWIVAKVSGKLKNKTFLKVLLALVFFALYYFVFFKGNDYIAALAQNAGKYAQAIKSDFYPLYFVGSSACEWLSMAVVNVVNAGLFVLVYRIISKSFIGIATATSAETKKKYKAEKGKAKSANAALLAKEFKRLASSSLYLLNACFGVLIMPVGGVALLVKGRDLLAQITQVYAVGQSLCAFVGIMAVCIMVTMVDTAIPSVSMEGKSVWIVKSLPITSWQIIRAKLFVQLILCGVPALFTTVCAFVAFKCTLWQVVTGVLAIAAFVAAYSLTCMALGIKTANLNWTNEAIPIKQNFAVALAPLFGFVYVAAFFAFYFLFGQVLAMPIVTAIFAFVTAIVAFLLYLWNKRKGAKSF